MARLAQKLAKKWRDCTFCRWVGRGVVVVGAVGVYALAVRSGNHDAIGDTLSPSEVLERVIALHGSEVMGGNLSRFTFVEDEIIVDRIDTGDVLTDFDKVDRYISQYRRRNKFPIVVVRDFRPTRTYEWYDIIDGQHRVMAAKKLGLNTIRAYVGKPVKNTHYRLPSGREVVIGHDARSRDDPDYICNVRQAKRQLEIAARFSRREDVVWPEMILPIRTKIREAEELLEDCNGSN